MKLFNSRFSLRRTALLGWIVVVGGVTSGWSGYPFDTDDAGVLARGEREAEITWTGEGEAGGIGATVQWGIAEIAQIGLSFGKSIFPESERGVEAPELVGKVALIPEWVALGFASNLFDGTTSTDLIVSMDPDDWFFSGSFGVEFVPEERSPGRQWGVAVAKKLPADLTGGVEWRGDHTGENGCGAAVVWEWKEYLTVAGKAGYLFDAEEIVWTVGSVWSW